MNYLHWDEKIITDFSQENVAAMYDKGYVFTRIGRGVMHQTRSCRIDLSKFEPSSENRRILKKTEDLRLSMSPLPHSNYNFTIGKLAKDFYGTKFGISIMSVQKIKEMLTDKSKSNFNVLLQFSDMSLGSMVGLIGYSICYEDESVFHYSYPFYDLHNSSKDMGLGMMIRAIMYAKDRELKYVYLGSLQRPGDTYKLQFAGLEWFDGKKWQTDTEPLKELLK